MQLFSWYKYRAERAPASSSVYHTLTHPNSSNMMSLKFPLTSKAWRLPADDSSWKNHRDMSLREIRLEAPGKGDVVIKIHAVSLN